MRGYLTGVSLAAIARGNRRMLAPLKARHASASTNHAEVLASLRERRTKAQEIKNPEERAATLDALKGERPIHPTLVAAGCAVVAAVVGWPMLHGHRTVIAAGAVTLWAIVALVLGQQTPEVSDAGASEADDDRAQEDRQERADQAPKPTVPTPAEAHVLTASLAAGGSSVLLTRLAADLAASRPGWEPSTKAVRTLLAEAGIRVREGVRTAAGNGPGVHHLDVPALPSPVGSSRAGGVVANVGPGQEPTPTPTTRPVATDRGFALQSDPVNPAHTIVVHTADAA